MLTGFLPTILNGRVNCPFTFPRRSNTNSLLCPCLILELWLRFAFDLRLILDRNHTRLQKVKFLDRSPDNSATTSQRHCSDSAITTLVESCNPTNRPQMLLLVISMYQHDVSNPYPVGTLQFSVCGIQQWKVLAFPSLPETFQRTHLSQIGLSELRRSC